MDNQEEIWKDIDGYDGKYQVSNLGRVISFSRMNPNGLILKTPPNLRRGYPSVALRKNGKQITTVVHRLVAKTFIPNPDNKPQVNHKNGIKTDNRVENLEWCTNAENTSHKVINNLIHYGERTKASKLTNASARELYITWQTLGLTAIQLGNMFGISQRQAAIVVRRESWVRLNGQNSAEKTATSFCHFCQKEFKPRGRGRHILWHKNRKIDCTITFSWGHTQTFVFSETQAGMKLKILT